MYQMLCFRARNTERQKPHPHLVQEWLGEQPQAPSPPCLPPCASKAALQGVGTDKTCLPVTFLHTQAPAQASAFFGGQLLTMPRAVLGHLTVHPDGRFNLERNLRPPFQRLQIPTSRLRQKLVQLFLLESVGQESCTDIYLTYLFVCLFIYLLCFLLVELDFKGFSLLA